MNESYHRIIVGNAFDVCAPVAHEFSSPEIRGMAWPKSFVAKELSYLTEVSGIADRTNTAESVHQVDAFAAIFARIHLAFVNIDLAVAA